MSSEYRQLQYELQCQEALLVLMQKLKTNQKLVSQQTNNLKQQQQQQQRTATPPVNATKLNSVAQPSATKISNVNHFVVLFIVFFLSWNACRIQIITIDQHQQNHRIQINTQSIGHRPIHRFSQLRILLLYHKQHDNRMQIVRFLKQQHVCHRQTRVRVLNRRVIRIQRVRKVEFRFSFFRKISLPFFFRQWN